MPEIVTRWEWRVFGSRLTAAETWLANHSSIGTQESDETYFLAGSGGRGIVKIRSALMDIKDLREVDRDRLERWEPVLKADFPLSKADVARVFEALDLAPPPQSQQSWTKDDFNQDFVGKGKPIRAVSVHKKRVRYSIAGCMVELSDVTANGIPTRTLAIESENPTAVVDLIRGMGMSGWANRSYPRGLAALIDSEPDRFAIIDVGTNSIKFHIGYHDGGYHSGGRWRTLSDRAEITRLGEGIEASGEIAPAALARAITALGAMADEAKKQGVRAVAAVGTAGLRLARNREAVLAAIRERTGITVEVISGEEEARLAYLAVVTWLGLATDSVVVFDTGGGSSQFTFGHGAEVQERFSVNVGAVRITERFGLAKAVPPEVLRDVAAALSKELGRLDGRPAPHALIGMGGAVTNVAAVMHGLTTYDPDVVQGTVIHRAEIDRQIELYASRDAVARRAIVGLQPKRAEVILAGTCIIRSIMQKLGSPSLAVSDRGLRHGLLVERLGP